MKIMSQNKKELIDSNNNEFYISNTNNTTGSTKNKYSIYATAVGRNTLIGQYDTLERAKQILQDMSNDKLYLCSVQGPHSYQSISYDIDYEPDGIIHPDSKIHIQQIDRPVYYMPEK